MEGIGLIFSLTAGIGVLVFVLWVFVFRDEYADVGAFPDSVEHEYLKRVAEGRISALCPGAIRLAERERAGRACGQDAAAAREFWRRFAVASASVEEDPVAALRELRGLSELLEEAIRVAEGETVATNGTYGREDEDEA